MKTSPCGLVASDSLCVCFFVCTANSKWLGWQIRRVPVWLCVAFQRLLFKSHGCPCYPLLWWVWFGTKDSGHLSEKPGNIWITVTGKRNKEENVKVQISTVGCPQKEKHIHWESMAGRRGGGVLWFFTFTTGRGITDFSRKRREGKSFLLVGNFAKNILAQQDERKDHFTNALMVPLESTGQSFTFG